MEGEGPGGARLAGTVGAEEKDLALGGEEEVPLPEVGLDAPGAEDERGVEGHRQGLGGVEHGASVWRSWAARGGDFNIAGTWRWPSFRRAYVSAEQIDALPEGRSVQTGRAWAYWPCRVVASSNKCAVACRFRGGSMSQPDQRENVFREKYANEQQAILRLAAKGLRGGAAGNLKLLMEIGIKGVTHVLAKRRRFPSRQEEISELVDEFILYGAKAALLTGAQRGGDFLNNQLRGQWAERVALSMSVDGLHIVEFGPSGAAMPGEEDHRQVIMTFGEIHLLEGKRPDLLAFEQPVWDDLTAAERNLASTWPKRRLEQADEDIVKKARCGIEVKNSTWHYEKRRSAGRGPLSITVKEQEVSQIQDWSRRAGLPVIFIQVLFDELYCMSFQRMEAAIQRGYVYEPGDYELDKQTGAGDKVYHKFHIVPPRHLCGKVVFPSESTAEVRVLRDGNVVPYINFKPAQAIDIVPQVILDEIAYAEPPTPPGAQQNQSP